MSDTAYLLAWNPNQGSSIDDIWNEFQRDGTAEATWSCASKQPEVGDEFFFLRLGNEPRGIIGHGEIIGWTKPLPHWKKPGEKIPYLRVRFDALSDPDDKPLISASALKKIPDQHWSPQSSGTKILPQPLSKLRNLWSHQVPGDQIVGPGERNPSWMRDELILALDLYVRSKGNPPGKSSAEIKELSAVLNQLTGAVSKTRPKYRNANGVYMKLMNFRRFDPMFLAQGKSGLTRGNKLEESVWKEFASDPKRLAQTAAAIKADLEVSPHDEDDLDNGIEEAEEGRRLTRAHLVRERSRKLVKAKKAACLKATGALRCEACEFEFKDKYGERGQGFIEVHHGLPLYQLKPGTKTRLEDLHVLCANCHRMIHAKRPWLTLDDLKECLITKIPPRYPEQEAVAPTLPSATPIPSGSGGRSQSRDGDHIRP
jgi:5-methylcytosine-specific restriction enzyme A